MRIDVLGVGFDNLTMTEAVSHGAALLEEPGCHYVVTPNPEIVEVCRASPAALQAVTKEDVRSILRQLTLSVSYLLTKEEPTHA